VDCHGRDPACGSNIVEIEGLAAERELTPSPTAPCVRSRRARQAARLPSHGEPHSGERTCATCLNLTPMSTSCISPSCVRPISMRHAGSHWLSLIAVSGRASCFQQKINEFPVIIFDANGAPGVLAGGVAVSFPTTIARYGARRRALLVAAVPTNASQTSICRTSARSDPVSCTPSRTLADDRDGLSSPRSSECGLRHPCHSRPRGRKRIHRVGSSLVPPGLHQTARTYHGAARVRRQALLLLLFARAKGVSRSPRSITSGYGRAGLRGAADSQSRTLLLRLSHWLIKRPTWEKSAGA